MFSVLYSLFLREKPLLGMFTHHFKNIDISSLLYGGSKYSWNNSFVNFIDTLHITSQKYYTQRFYSRVINEFIQTLQAIVKQLSTLTKW